MNVFQHPSVSVEASGTDTLQQRRMGLDTAWLRVAGGAADPISLTPLGCPASDFSTLFLVLVLLLGPLLATRPQPFIFRTWDCPGPLTRCCLRGQHGLALPGIANALPSFPHFWQCRAICSASGAWPSFEGFLWGSVQAGSNLL